MSRRALSTLELTAALPCLLFVLVVGGRSGRLGLGARTPKGAAGPSLHASPLRQPGHAARFQRSRLGLGRGLRKCRHPNRVLATGSLAGMPSGAPRAGPDRFGGATTHPCVFASVCQPLHKTCPKRSCGLVPQAAAIVGPPLEKTMMMLTLALTGTLLGCKPPPPPPPRV